MHVHRGLFLAPAEQARLWDDVEGGEALLSDAEPALHPRVAVAGLQHSVVGGRRGEVPGMEVGRGVGRAQGCLSSVRGRVVELCVLCDGVERLHGVRKSHCHVFLGGLDPGQAPLKTLLLMLRQT